MKCTVIHAVLYDVILSISSSFALVPYRQVSRVFDDEASESDAGMRAYEGFASLLFRLLLSHLNQFSIVFFFLFFSLYYMIFTMQCTSYLLIVMLFFQWVSCPERHDKSIFLKIKISIMLGNLTHHVVYNAICSCH